MKAELFESGLKNVIPYTLLALKRLPVGLRYPGAVLKRENVELFQFSNYLL